MNRREFVTLIGGAAATPWLLPPFAAHAQQPPMPVVGFLHIGSPGPFQQLVAQFRRGVGEAGFTEGQNVEIEYRWAEGRYDQLPAIAADYVRRPVAVIAAFGGEPGVVAAKAATSTIPVVFLMGGDPVSAGLVASLNRPSGNLTGFSFLTERLEAKRLGLLRELVPSADVIGALVDPNFPASELQAKDVQDATASLGVRAVVLRARPENDFDDVFATLARERADALLVCASPNFNNRRDLLVAAAARQRIPAIYELREFAAAGGLISYGTSITDAARQVGIYVGRILKGAKPADLPVLQPTRFELVINLKAAKALGLDVPPTLIARADEVIE